MQRSSPRPALALALLVLLGACRDGGDAGGASTTAPGVTTTRPPVTTAASTTSAGAATTTTAEPTTTATTAPAPSTTRAAPTTTGGEASPTCIDGWTTPARGTPTRQAPLDLMRAQMGVTGLFEVVDMRYFTGPEVPWILSPRPPFVERWYVKARLADDPAFRARWIVERRDESRAGISAVAGYDTTGYASPDWRGFVGEGTPRAVPGLPGTWVGIEYDFVTGEGDGDNPGLPTENESCLDGT